MTSQEEEEALAAMGVQEQPDVVHPLENGGHFITMKDGKSTHGLGQPMEYHFKVPEPDEPGGDLVGLEELKQRWPFPEIHIISIDEERLKACLERMGDLRYFVKSVQGIDGRVHKAPPGFSQPPNQYTLHSEGQIGCYRSHMEAWRQVAKSGGLDPNPPSAVVPETEEVEKKSEEVKETKEAKKPEETEDGKATEDAKENEPPTVEDPTLDEQLAQRHRAQRRHKPRPVFDPPYPKQPASLIIEDDANLRPVRAFLDHLDVGYKQASRFPWGIFYVGRNLRLTRHRKRLGSRLVEVGRTWGLFAYALTPQAAHDLLTFSTPMVQAVDIFVSTHRRAIKYKFALSPVGLLPVDSESSTAAPVIKPKEGQGAFSKDDVGAVKTRVDVTRSVQERGGGEPGKNKSVK